jgi:hypothetical protein
MYSELQRANNFLNDKSCLKSILKDVITVKKADFVDQCTWSKIVSKLSSFISNILEIALVNLLNESQDDSNSLFEWKRSKEKVFPDVKLFHKSGEETDLGIEVKVVCSEADEASSRFLHCVENLKEGDVYVCVLAWKWENDEPVVFDSFVHEAFELARRRDLQHVPPKKLIIQPTIQNKKTNTEQSTVKYKVWDTTQSEEELRNAMKIVTEWTGNSKGLIRVLEENFKYRNDNNMGKLQRIDCIPLKLFLKRIKQK